MKDKDLEKKKIEEKKENELFIEEQEDINEILGTWASVGSASSASCPASTASTSSSGSSFG